MTTHVCRLQQKFGVHVQDVRHVSHRRLPLQRVIAPGVGISNDLLHDALIRIGHREANLLQQVAQIVPDWYKVLPESQKRTSGQNKSAHLWFDLEYDRRRAEEGTEA